MRRVVVAASVMIASALAPPLGYAQGPLSTFVGCPAGQAIQGINFTTRSIVCVAVPDITALQAEISALRSALASVQDNGALALAPYVSVQTGPINGLAGPHVIFTGANVHIRSGSGSTDDDTTSQLGGDGKGTLTSLGNLVIGYDESPGT